LGRVHAPVSVAWEPKHWNRAAGEITCVIITPAIRLVESLNIVGPLAVAAATV
jgi:hypothetical protein